MKEAQSKRPWFRYTLRSALVVITIVGIGFGLVARHAHQRQAAIALVRDNSGQIQFADWTPSWLEKQLARFFGAETYQPVRSVNMLTGGQIKIDKKRLPPDFLARLSALPELEILGLENTIIAGDDWKNIAAFKELRYILLGYSNIPDEAMNYVAELPKLDTLSASDAKELTDAALVFIAQMPALDNLKLAGTKITDAGLRTFTPRSPIRIVELHSLKISSVGVKSLAKIPSLIVLHLAWTEVDDTTLDDLSGLPNLQQLQLQRTNVTREVVERFRQSHPHVTVNGP